MSCTLNYITVHSHNISFNEQWKKKKKKPITYADPGIKPY